MTRTENVLESLQELKVSPWSRHREEERILRSCMRRERMGSRGRVDTK